MKIIFNLINTGIGNNGGSASVIKSANTLKSLGEDVIIIVNGKSNYTWSEINAPVVKVKDVNEIDGDVIIATGINTLDSTNKSKISNKFIWIRGYEIWNVSEDKFIKMLKESKCKKIVNSIGLQNKLKKYSIESNIIRPGYDFEKLYPLNIRKNNKRIILGGLYNEGKKRSGKRTNWIFDVYNSLKKKHFIELWMFGSDGTPKLHIDNYIKNPDDTTKNEIYNKINIWLSTSELEGLHIPPAEALLTECCVVGVDCELSGTIDYLTNEETGILTKNDFHQFLSGVEKAINSKNIRKSLGRNGRNKILSLGNRKDNMKRMIELLKNEQNNNL